MKQADRRTLERVRDALRSFAFWAPTAQREDQANNLARELDAMLAPKRTRSARPPAKRATPRRSERVKDPAYREWVIDQTWCALAEWQAGRCVVFGERSVTVRGTFVHVCRGRIEGAHLGRRPLGRKASDRTMAPVCCAGHDELTNGKHLTLDERREFSEWAIALAEQRYEAAKRNEAVP